MTNRLLSFFILTKKNLETHQKGLQTIPYKVAHTYNLDHTTVQEYPPTGI